MSRANVNQRGGLTAVIDTGANLASITTALERLGADWRVTDSPAVLRRARRLVLPGVGAAAPAMRRLREAALDRELKRSSQPLLGICLGMQLLADSSAEGDVECLGLVPGRVERLEPGPGLPVPHMGWNRLRLNGGDTLLRGVPDGAHVYFVHGYALPVDGACLARCDYGAAFTAALASGTRFGVQFHPERSGPVGARILANFLESA